MTVRVLVVDDSATIRALIAARLEGAGGIEVVGEAADPLEARAAIKALNPDVVTLDIEMPNMNGLDFLERLMRLRPTPVIMVSSLTERGAEAAVEALALGAFGCVGKPKPEAGGFDDLVELVREAGRWPPPPRVAERPAVWPHPFKSDGRVLAIGASTGGVEALVTVLSRFPANCPPTLVVQHMPGGFTRSFAERLNRHCAPLIVEAAEGAAVVPGTVHLAPGGMHLEMTGGLPRRCHLQVGGPAHGHRPSVDVLFGSVGRVGGRRAVGVILTGMGRDGAEGLLAMRRAGADTLGQDEASSVVYGMPRVAFAAGAVGEQVPLDRMAERILTMMNAQPGPRA